jgi:hypothetical protein
LSKINLLLLVRNCAVLIHCRHLMGSSRAERQECRLIVHRKSYSRTVTLFPHGHPSSTNVAPPFIDHSRGMWNFGCDRLSLSFASEKGEAMRKTLMALAAVATLAVSAVAAPAPAHAQRGVAAGVAAGLIGGAIVGGALAGPRYYGYGPGYYYGPGYGYYGGPAYVADDYCSWQRQRFWDGYGWRVRRVRVCG